MKTQETLTYESSQGVKRASQYTPAMEERRNSEKALRYLAEITRAILNGERIEQGSTETSEILANLASLQEFIRDKESSRRAVVAGLIQALLSQYPKDEASWKKFIRGHWHQIWAFTKAYSQDEDWLNQANYQRVSALVSGRPWLFLWWWRRLSEKLNRLFRKPLSSYQIFLNAIFGGLVHETAHLVHETNHHLNLIHPFSWQPQPLPCRIGHRRFRISRNEEGCIRP